MPGKTGMLRPQTPSRTQVSRFGVRAVSSSVRPPLSHGRPPRPSATSRTILLPFGSRSSRISWCRFMWWSLPGISGQWPVIPGKLHHMNLHQLMRELREPNGSKIVLLVADGLGGLPCESGGLTELETARTPNLDTCVREGVCGLSIPVLPGITPGSGPGHLGLFGYDPLEYRIGRGILEALGINFPVGPRDVAIRGNFCTLDAQGRITDRRAGRPPTERCVAMCKKLATIKIPRVEIFVEPVREHRFVV